MQKLKFYPTYEEAKRAVAGKNIKSKDEYKKRYKEDPRLPSEPNSTYANQGWINWLDFLGKPTKVFYPTFEKAKRAVAVINIKSKDEYQKRYKEDPRLPSNPNIFYKDKGWIGSLVFLGKPIPDLYSTYKEAKRAVKRSNIKSQDEYKKRYKEDPRLPSNPNKYYKDKGRIDWFNLFGKPIPDLYPTYKEAKQAVKRLNIKNQIEYHKRHKEDPRLPSTPYAFYKDKGWIGWSDYFGKPTKVFYPTYEELKRAIKRLNIKTSTEYHKRYKEDPRLPSNPHKYYKDKGWIDFFDFFRKVKK